MSSNRTHTFGEVTAQAGAPYGPADERERIVRSLVELQGQPALRRKLLEVQRGGCVINGCAIAGALGAAHIVPYAEPSSNRVSNDLLLRADLHALFDLGLVAMNPVTMPVIIAPNLAGTSDAMYDGVLLRRGPSGDSPDPEARGRHRAWPGCDGDWPPLAESHLQRFLP